MRLWHKDLISYLPDQQLLGQWRECCAIAVNIKNYGSPNHILVNRIMDYKLSHFYRYCQLIVGEMQKRGFKVGSNSINKIIAITDCDIRMQADCFLTNDELFAGWHDDRYFMQCYCNLEEKYDCGGIKQLAWNRLMDGASASMIISEAKTVNEIRADERRKFAEWLQEKSVDNSISLKYGKFSNRDIDEVIAEYEKEQKNENIQM